MTTGKEKIEVGRRSAKWNLLSRGQLGQRLDEVRPLVADVAHGGADGVEGQCIIRSGPQEVEQLRLRRCRFEPNAESGWCPPCIAHSKNAEKTAGTLVHWVERFPAKS